MSKEIPAHLNPNNDPERASQLREAQQSMLNTNGKMVAAIKDGQTRFPDLADWDDLMARLERIRQQILAWDCDPGEMEDFMMHFTALGAEAEANLVRSTSVIMQKIVNASEESLGKLSEQERVQHFEMVSEWKEQKDAFLGVLPIEERKRIEEPPASQ
jgi:hypothetical protein